MEQFYTMHEQKCTKTKAYKQNNKERHINNNPQTKQKDKDQKKKAYSTSLPSGVAILSNVCGVAMIVHSDLDIKQSVRQRILVFYKLKEGMRVAT